MCPSGSTFIIRNQILAHLDENGIKAARLAVNGNGIVAAVLDPVGFIVGDRCLWTTQGRHQGGAEAL